MLGKLTVTGIPFLERQDSWALGPMTLIVGNNGSGKSLLLDLTAALLSPQIPSRINELVQHWGVSVAGEFITHSQGMRPLILRREMSIQSRRQKVTTWLDGAEYVGDTSAATGHELIYPGDTLYRPDQTKVISTLYRKLTGRTTASRQEQIRTMGDIVERHSDRFEGNLGRISISPDGVILWHRYNREPLLPFIYTPSAGERVIGAYQLVLSMALEIAQTRPTILLLDSPFSLLEASAAVDMYNCLSTLASANLQLIVAAAPITLPACAVADTTIRLTRKERPGSSSFSCKWPSSDEVTIETTQAPQNQGLANIERAVESYGPGTEDVFINDVLRPGFVKLGYRGVRRVNTHGPQEFGVDIGPFYVSGPFGRDLFVGVQAKVGRIHSTAGKVQQSIEPLIVEVRKALREKFLDANLNIYRRLDYVIAVTSGHFTPEARRTFFSEFDGDNRVIMWEAQDLAEQFWRVSFYPRAISTKATTAGQIR